MIVILKIMIRITVLSMKLLNWKLRYWDMTLLTVVLLKGRKITGSVGSVLIQPPNVLYLEK